MLPPGVAKAACGRGDGSGKSIAPQQRTDRLFAKHPLCAYRGQLIEWVREHLGAVLAIVARAPDQKGFQVLPRRWVVERTLAWLGRYRRLSKDYEHCLSSSEGMIYIASIHTMLKRLVAA